MGLGAHLAILLGGWDTTGSRRAAAFTLLALLPGHDVTDRSHCLWDGSLTARVTEKVAAFGLLSPFSVLEDVEDYWTTTPDI